MEGHPDGLDPVTVFSARGWRLIGLLRMLLAVVFLVLAGSAAIPIVLAMHGTWGRILAAFALIVELPS